MSVHSCAKSFYTGVFRSCVGIAMVVIKIPHMVEMACFVVTEIADLVVHAMFLDIFAVRSHVQVNSFAP